jgi:hypothetical protein
MRPAATVQYGVPLTMIERTAFLGITNWQRFQFFSMLIA